MHCKTQEIDLLLAILKLISDSNNSGNRDSEFAFILALNPHNFI
jgi:hypothetical protein